MEIIDDDNRDTINDYNIQKYFGEIQPRNLFFINHLKLNGRMTSLKPGKIQSMNIDPDEPIRLTLKRKFYEGGNYDGLNTPIERGDFAISIFEENNWYYKTEYFSFNGTPKGKYFNINTPLEITNHSIQYIDLEIDVIENVAGDRKIIDAEKLQKAFDLKIITEEIFEKANTLAKNIKEDKI